LIVNTSQPGPSQHSPNDIDTEALPRGTTEDRRSFTTDADEEVAASRTLTRTSTKPYTLERFAIEQALQTERTRSIALVPTKDLDGTILVDWYTTDDPSNPQNWSSLAKLLVLLQLCLYSLVAYGASSMYVSGIQGVMEELHVGSTPATLGLAIYIIGYGIGSLVFAPLSEIAAVGRNWIYAPTFFLFVILSIPTALVRNYAGLLVLRFLTGFLSSPSLANGGASIGDMVCGSVAHTDRTALQRG
jgi:DHA1 family multidrug resistance protein-like MFS transporter